MKLETLTGAIATAIGVITVLAITFQLSACFTMCQFHEGREGTDVVTLSGAHETQMCDGSWISMRSRSWQDTEYFLPENESLKLAMKAHVARIWYVEHNSYGIWHGDYCRGRFVVKVEEFP